MFLHQSERPWLIIIQNRITKLYSKADPMVTVCRYSASGVLNGSHQPCVIPKQTFLQSQCAGIHLQVCLMEVIIHVIQAFFEEERRELERKRTKIRLLQQRKTADVTNCKDLPGEIPLQLVIGTKVTARLRKPQDGLFNGSIDAVDTSNNTYRITFERTGLGTHSVPDYEVLVSIFPV